MLHNVRMYSSVWTESKVLSQIQIFAEPSLQDYADNLNSSKDSEHYFSVGKYTKKLGIICGSFHGLSTAARLRILVKLALNMLVIAFLQADEK